MTVHPTASIQAGLFDEIQQLADGAETTIQIVASAVVLAFILIWIARSHMALGRVVIAGFVGAIALWLVWGGVDWFKGQVGDEIESAPASISIVTTDSV